MFKPTHKAMATTVAVGTSIALSPTLLGAAVIVLSARGQCMMPDKMERWFGVKMDDHRTWTHWLLTAVVASIIIGALVYLAGYGVAELAKERMVNAHGTTTKDGREFANAALQVGYSFGFLIGLGVLIGAVIHDLADACTVGGVPLLGPFTKKKYWIVPKGMRVYVGELAIVTDPNTGKPKKVRTRELTKGERVWLMGAHAMTLSILFFYMLPYMNMGSTTT